MRVGPGLVGAPRLPPQRIMTRAAAAEVAVAGPALEVMLFPVTSPGSQQMPPLLKHYGIPSPISLAPPRETACVLTQKLIETL